MPTVKAASDSGFVDSLGINMNISAWTSQADMNVTADENALAYLGLKMVRGGLYTSNVAAFTQIYNDLGVKYDFLVTGISTAGFNASIQVIEANPGIIDYIEGPNETDESVGTANYNGLTGLAATAAEMQAIDAAIESDPQTANIPIIQASFGIPSTFATYGNHAGTADYTSNHIYYNFFPFGTDPLENGAYWMQTLLADAQIVTPGVPNIATETGYETLAGTGNAVSLIDQAKYLLDDVFDLWNAGLAKTFIFELVDAGPNSADPSDPSNNYGIYNADWTPKPAAIAIHNLMTLLADTGTGGVAPGSLTYTLTGEPSTVQTTLLEKSNGTFVLAIWNDVQLQNSAGVDTPVASVPVTLTLGSAFESITIYDPLTGTSAIQSFANASTVQIMVPDHPVLIEISNSTAAVSVAAANLPVINAPSEVLVPAGGIARVGGLSVGNDQLGTLNVTVSDSYGKLAMQDANGQALAGSGTGSITLSGSAAIVNAELATLAYTAASGGGGDVISVQVTGATGAAQNDFITVGSIARPAPSFTIGPLFSVPNAITVGTGTSAAIPDVVLTDDYYANNPGNLSLTVSVASGKLQMQSNGSKLTAQSLTVAGSYATIVADLASLTYVAGSAAGADTLSFQVTDAGGYSTTASTAIAVAPDLAVTGASALPVVLGTSALVGAQIDDAQASGNADTVQVTVSDVTGTLSMLGASGTPLAGSGGHSITLSGTPDQINSALATLTETAPSSAATDTITISAKDAEGVATTGTLNVTVLPALGIAAPAALAASTNLVVPVAGLVLSDSHASTGGTETVVLTDTSGKLSMTDGSGNVISGSGGHSITITGSLAVVNADLASLTYTAPAGTTTDSISIAASDSAGGSTSASIAVPVTAMGTPTSYFQLSDTANDAFPRQTFLSSGSMVLNSAATGLNGTVSEQALDGTVTLTAQQWNTVYAATITDTTGNSYVMNNFRSSNANLSAGSSVAGQTQILTVNGAQNGTINLGTGNQNVIINAGLGGSTPSTNNGFVITEGSGADSLVFNGYAGYLPTTNVANLTTATVTAGAGTEVMTFTDAHEVIKAGSGNLTIYGDNYGTSVTAGTGAVDVTGGTGYNNYTYHSGNGMMTIEDYVASETALTIDKSLQPFMVQSVTSNGILLTFGNSPQSGILLKGLTSFSASSITWSGSAASNIANSAGQLIGIASPGTVAAATGVVVPVTGVAITDAYAAANGLTETVVVSDSSGKLSMTNSAGAAVAGSGSHSIVLSGSVGVVDAELASLTYTAPAGAVTDSILIGATDTAGGSSSASIAVPVTTLGTLPAYFQLLDTAGDPIGKQPILSSGTIVLTTAATGLNGSVSEQVAGGVVTLTAQQWNTVYANTVTDSTGTSYVLNNFRAANANLSAGPTAAGQAQTLTINTAQNGTIVLGTGNQNVVINAGLGGSTTSTNNGFGITEGSGTDSLTFNGYAGYLPTTNVANLTTAIVTAGSGTEVMTFTNAHEVITAGSGNLTIHGDNYGTSVTAGTGAIDVTGGTGYNNFTYHSGNGMMTIEDYGTNDTLILDKSLQPFMAQSTVSNGILLSFGNFPQSGILLKGLTAFSPSAITWSGAAASNVNNSAGQAIGIAAPSSVAVNTTVVAPVTGVAITDAYATSNGLTETVVVNDTYGKLSMTDGSGNALAGSGSHSMEVSGTVAAVNAELATLTYTAPGSAVTDSISIAASDTAGGSSSKTVSIPVTSLGSLPAYFTLGDSAGNTLSRQPILSSGAMVLSTGATGLDGAVSEQAASGTITLAAEQWNTVNAVTVTDNAGNAYVLNNFVTANATLTAGPTTAGQAQSLTLNTVQNGTITLGTGNQNVVVNAGLGGTAAGTNNTFSITEGSGTDALTFNGNAASLTAAIVKAGSGTEVMSFTGSNATITAGAGSLTIHGDNYGTNVTAGTGAVDITGGTGANSFTYHAGSGMMTIEDFGANDTLVLDAKEQAFLAQSVVSNGILLSFGNSPQSSILLKGVTAFSPSSITWSGSAASNVANSGGQVIGIAAPGTLAASAGVVVPVMGVAITDSYAVSKGLQETVVVDDSYGGLSMTNSGGAAVAGSGSHSIELTGSVAVVNAELATLTYTAPSVTVTDSISIGASDTAGGSSTASISVPVTSLQIGIAAPGTLAASTGVVVPVTGVSVTDSYATSKGLTETVVVSDGSGKLSMTNSAGAAVAGSGGNTITLTGSVAVVDAELASLTYSAGPTAGTDNISIAVSNTGGGSNSASIAVPVTTLGTLPAYFQLLDTAGDPIGKQPILSSGTIVLTTAATGLNGAVSEQVAGGVVTLTAQQWNTVYANTVTDSTGTSYVLNNFRAANANLGAGPTAAGQAQTLTINTAQNGTIVLGTGNQNVVINAGLGGSTTSTNNGFSITEGSGTDSLTFNGYAGYLPTTNVANLTTAIVTAGSGTEVMTFTNAHEVITAGSGNLTIHGDNYGTSVTAGTGAVDITGGTGYNNFTYHSGNGMMTIEDYGTNDTLILDKSLQAFMVQSTVSNGILLSFTNSPQSGILLKGATAFAPSSITWSGSAASNIANSAGQIIGIAAPGSVAAGTGVVVPVTGLAITDAYAAANGLTETVVVSDSYGALSMTDSTGNAVAGSGGNSIELTGSVAAVNAELASLTYTAPIGAVSDSVSIGASDTAGGSSSASIAVQVSPLGTPAAYFQLLDTAGDPLGIQPVLSSGAMQLTTAATGLNGAVNEQVANGTVTLTAQQWNTVYAATVTDTAGAGYVLNNFRSANANLSTGPTAAGRAESLTINTAQNGTIVLGTGNQNIYVNAGLGGSTTSSNNGFNITEGSGTDSLIFNGYAGYLPTTNVANLTTAIVTAGSGTEVMSFTNAHAVIAAGSGTLTVNGDAYGTSVTAGTGAADITGGAGYNNFTYHFGSGMMTIEDYGSNDTLILDKSLQPFMAQSVVSNGILLSFGNFPQSGILLKGLTSFSPSAITWSGAAASNTANSAGQMVGIATAGTVAAGTGVVAPVTGLAITDAYATANGLTETVVVNDISGKLSMTDGAGNPLAGSGTHSMEVSGTVAAVNADLATLTYTAPSTSVTDSISIAASDTAGGSSSTSIAMPVTALGTPTAYFQLYDTAGDPIGIQPVLNGGAMLLSTAATGLNGSVSEQAANGVVTLTAQQWNTVNAVAVSDNAGGSYVLNNFSTANANLNAGPAGAGQVETLTINTAQNGTVNLGTGNQNVVINAGLGGTAAGANNSFVITESSGTDTLTFNGYAGYLPASNLANLSTAIVTAGSGTEAMTFTNAHAVITAGSGNLTIYGDNYGTSVTAGTGAVDITGGTGPNNFTYHSGSGMMTLEDYGANDTLILDKSLQPFMAQSVVSNGILLSFGNAPQSGILLKGVTSFSPASITWTGNAASNIANSAGQTIGIAASGSVAAGAGEVVPVTGVSITDAYATSNGLTETVVVNDSNGALSMTDGAGNPLAGSGSHSMALTGTVAMVNAELATLTYTAASGAGADSISIGASDTAGGSSSASIAVPVTALGNLPAYFQLGDMAGDALGRQAFLSSGAMLLSTAATGLDGAVSEQAANGVVTLAAQQWNTVNAATVTDNAGTSYVLNNFVTANATLGAGPTAAGQAQTLTLNTVQNGTINLGTGNQNVVINAGLGGTAPSTNNVFNITETSGTDTLTVNGNAANSTSAIVTAGSGSEVMTFNNANATITGGTGNLTVHGGADGTILTAGTGAIDLWGGSGANSFTYHAGDGMLTIEDFGANDTLVLDASEQAFIAQSVVSNGILLSFGNSSQSGILLKGVTSFSQSSITWSGGAFSNTANSAGQMIGIAAPGSLAASIGVVVPVTGVSVTDAYAAANGLTETVVVNDSVGGLSMTNSAGNAVAGSGSHSIEITGSVAVVNAELASLTYTAPAATGADSISIAASDTAGGASTASIAVPVTSLQIGIAAPGSVAAGTGVVVPVTGVSVTDSYASANGLTETVVVSDSSGKLSMLNSAGTAVAGSGGNAITLTGSVAVVDAELASLTYTAPAGASTDSISIAASNSAGGSNSASIAIPVSAFVTPPAYFQVLDTANDPFSKQPILSGGGMVLTTAATGLNGAIDEQVANGIVTFTAEQWNTVWADTVTDSTGTSYVLNNFRSAVANLSAGPTAAGQAQSLTINTAQSGTITLGTGNQNVTINAGLGGATTSTNNGFVITEGNGTDSLTFNGYAGYLPTSNVANLTTAIVTAGSGAEVMTFTNAHEVIMAGSGNLTIHGDNYGTSVTAGTGAVDITGGTGYNNFTYHSGNGMMTIEDYGSNDTLILDKSLQPFLVQSAVSGGILLSFTNSPQSGILLKGATAFAASSITWSGAAASNIANSAGQKIGIAAPASVAAGTGVVVPVTGVSITDAYASANGLTETVVVNDSAGKLSMTNSAGSAVAGSGGNSIELTGSVAVVNAELATLTYSAPAGAVTDSISIGATDNAGGSSAASIAVPVTTLGALPNYFQLLDTAGDPFGKQPVLSSGGMVLTTAATGLSGGVSEQVASGVVTFTAQQWNTVYADNITDSTGTSYVLNNFRSANATLSAGPTASGQAQSLTINGAQNGTIILGTGNQNVVVNAGLGGSTTSTNNGFVITEGSGTGTLTFNGYAGYLPTSNVGNITQASVTAGSGTETMTFVNDHSVIKAGTGNLTIYGSNYGTSVTASTGALTVTGGTGYNNFTFHSGDGVMTIQDFSTQDTLYLDKSMQAGMTQTTVSGGIELLFSSSPNSAIFVKGQTANLSAHITWQ